MKALTADKVLRKTFEYLDTVLDEKNRQIKKASKASRVQSSATNTHRQGSQNKGSRIVTSPTTSDND